MGTRGCVEIVYKGQSYPRYNQFDSYPDFLGKALVNWINAQGLHGIVKLLDETTFAVMKSGRLIFQDANGKRVSTEYEKYSDMDELYHNTKKIYEMAKDEDFLQDRFWLADAHLHKFPYDCIFCENVYVLDVDNNRFEIYRSVIPHVSDLTRLKKIFEFSEGRYKYDNCDGGIQVLLLSHPLNDISDTWEIDVRSFERRLL